MPLVEVQENSTSLRHLAMSYIYLKRSYDDVNILTSIDDNCVKLKDKQL